MCVREVVRNIIEQNSKAGERVGLQLLEEILNSCPVKFNLPLEIEPGQVKQKRSDMIVAKISSNIIEIVNLDINDSKIKSGRIRSKED